MAVSAFSDASTGALTSSSGSRSPVNPFDSATSTKMMGSSASAG